MALRDSVHDTLARRIRYERFDETLRLGYRIGASWPRNKRSHTIVTKEWCLLTEAAAVNYVDCHALDTNTRYRAEEVNKVLREWRLTAEIDSAGEWVLDTSSVP